MPPTPKGTKFEKSPPQLVARFETVIARHPALVPRKMFGCPCTFVGGNLASGLFADGWFVRLGDEAAVELLAIPGAGPFSPMQGRPMRGYTLLPPSVIADDAALGAWLERCIAFTGTLPAK